MAASTKGYRVTRTWEGRIAAQSQTQREPSIYRAFDHIPSFTSIGFVPMSSAHRSRDRRRQIRRFARAEAMMSMPAREWYLRVSGRARAYRKTTEDDCYTCDEMPPDAYFGECASSRRPCGHHCNHSYGSSSCCWCDWQQEAYEAADIDKHGRIIAAQDRRSHETTGGEL